MIRLNVLTETHSRLRRRHPQNHSARVHPGVVQHDLHGPAPEHGLTFGPDPATRRWHTPGGMVGNDSCGVHSRSGGGKRGSGGKGHS
jgi:FAD/FMN-containing dehydrogenase